jgi:hypothetical protein
MSSQVSRIGGRVWAPTDTSGIPGRGQPSQVSRASYRSTADRTSASDEQARIGSPVTGVKDPSLRVG